MKKITLCIIIFVNLILAFSVQALEIKDFTESEYAFGVDEPTNLKMAPSALDGKRAEFYNFINFKPGKKKQLVTYLDTPDRLLYQKSLIIRVREDIKKPGKSKLTVKIRAASPEGFGDLKNYKKAEIDIVNGKKKYSVSYDIKYNPNDIDIRHVDIQVVFQRIEEKSPDAWALVEPFAKNHMIQIQQTIVMCALSWEGIITKVPGRVEADLAIWSPYYKQPKMFITQLSFKGKTGDFNLEKVSKRIQDALKAKNLLSETIGSKTKATFKMSPNFN